MSFLKQESNATNNGLLKASSSSKNLLPSSYEDSECQVVLEPVAKPIGTNLYNREQHRRQAQIIDTLKSEAPSLFQQQSVIRKESGDERMYKQKQQFSSKISVESLAEVLEKEGLCLRASFARPGFNSHNSSFMITAGHLNELMTTDPNEHSLKQKRFYVAGDEESAQRNGYVIFSVKTAKDGHNAYSLDYHALTEADDKLFSEH
jgi:hypothetical protein